MRVCTQCGNPLGRSGYQKIHRTIWIHKECVEGYRKTHPDFVDVWLNFFEKNGGVQNV